MAAPKQCFISYSHHDAEGFERLRTHLKAVSRLYGFKLVHDDELRAGQHWDNALKKMIENSDMFVLLFSNDFYQSDYIYDDELPAILERHRAHNALVIPVVYRESIWRHVFGRHIEVLPKTLRRSVRPICEWEDREQAFALTANAIGAAVTQWFGVEPRSPFRDKHRRKGARK